MWIWCIVSENCERLKNDDISWIRKPTKERMTRADAVKPTCWDRAQISYALQPRILRYVPLCIHARVIESMRNHECALQSSIHAKTAACCATYDMLHMHMWLRGHTSMQWLRTRNPCFAPPSTIVQCGVRSRQGSSTMHRRRRQKNTVTMLNDQANGK